MLEDDDPDVFVTGLLQRYQARPTKIEDTCLAEFASKYRSAPTHTGNDSQPDNMFEEDSSTDVPTNRIHLQNGLGSMILRSNPAIVRSHQWSLKKQPDQYYHAQLLLYLPWRDEKEDLNSESYQDTYESNLAVIQQNRNNFEHHADEVSQAMENIQEFGPPEESWQVLAPQTEQAQYEDQEEGPHAIPGVLGAFDTGQQHTANRDLGLTPYEVEFTTEVMTNQEWYNLLMSLNNLQTQVHEFIVHWCTQMLLTHRQKKPDPFHLFLTGGAGVGKSHLVRAIVQAVKHMFCRNNQSNDMHVLVCAPTGAAAYNISGYTLHAAFLLPLNVKKSDDYIPLSGEKLASLKEMVGNIKILVIDEISMVGADMLLTVHRRLCDIMGNDEPFGGVSILAVGDLLQLPPVAQKPVFSPSSDEMAGIYGSLWQHHFRIIELTEIQRQKDDLMFASLLNRVRTGSHTENDLKSIQSRQILPDSAHYPNGCTHIYAYNKDVYDHNLKMLDTLPGPKYTFKAEDSKKDDQTGRVNTSSFQDMSGGLASFITLAVGARVILTKNIDVQDGLVNSAAGIVCGFYPEPEILEDSDTYKPKYILVKFDDERVGKRNRIQSQRIIPDKELTPIATVESQIRLGKYSKVTAKRIQFPLCLAWAVTIHKEQGKTENKLVVSCKGTFHVGQFYTAISRTKDMNGLFILGEVKENKLKVNTAALQEINRMKTSSSFQPLRLDTMQLTVTRDTYFKIQCSNINSLPAHQQSMEKDGFTTDSHITCISETWLRPCDNTPNFPDHSSINSVKTGHVRNRGGGLLMFLHHDLRVIKDYCDENISTEHQIVIVAPRADLSLRLCIVSLYHHPSLTATQFLPHLEKIISRIPQGLQTIITGDFNIDMLSNTSASRKLSELLRYYGYHPCVSVPTHRKGGQLDNIFMNFPAQQLIKDVTPKYYTDHFLISVAIPWANILHH